MQKFKQSLAVKALAWVLAVAITVTMTPMPFAAFAGEPTPGGTATRDAEGDIASGTIANDAPNAVHAFVGVQTGGDANLPLANATGQQFKPIQGVKAYFQWFEDGGYVSPVYSAVSDANGRLNIDCKPYVASDGKIIKFDADPTVSGGHEKYRFWIDDASLAELNKKEAEAKTGKQYQLQYITGEQVVFPPGIATITQGGSGSNTAKNTHENWKILLMQKPKAEMHKTATPTQNEADGGYIKGKVSWDYNSPSGGVQWKYIAHQTTPAAGVTVKASYLSDYAMKKIYSDDMAVKLSLGSPSAIRGKGWTSKLEGQLQDEIKKQMKGEEDKWIAETVTAVSNSEGDYILQFNGTWGYKQNADVAKGYTEQAGKFGWTQQALDRLGTVAAKASDGSFKDAALNYNEKHINLDWLFVSTEGTEDLRVMTPYNNNWYTAMNSDWGIHNGWSGASIAKEFSVGVTNIANRSMKSDFVFGINKVNFTITNYDSRANTAIPGDIAQTSTTGLPYSNTSDKFRIVWYDQDGNEVKTGPSAQPSSTGTLPSCPLDTETDISGGVTKTTEFTAKLYRVDSEGNNAELIAGDSFTVEVSHLFISRYDEVNLLNPKANDPEMKDAKYSATGLPADLTIDSSNGTISGKAKEAGLSKATFTTSLSDKDAGEIKGTRERYIAVTDSPLAAGEVGKAYSQDVKPVPEKDPKNKAYIYKMKSVSFVSGKEVAGLEVEGNATVGFKITGTPTAEVKATEDVGDGLLGPNVEVTYDIYKTNDAGDEVLVKPNHKDLVPLVVEKATDASSYLPDYTAVDGKVGVAATVAAPKFLDEKSTETTKPEADPQPTGMTFTLGEGAPTDASIDAKTGAVTYTPVAADAGKPVNVPVVVTYKDGTKDDATATINVKAYSDQDVIPYVPADKEDPTNPDDTNVPTKDKDGKTVDKTQYDIVAFKVADTDKTKGSLTLGDKDKKQVISALVKKDSKWDKVTVPTINVADANTKANGYKPAIPAKTETVENGKVYTAQFITNGQEITPGTDLPDGVFEVKVLRDETSIKDNALYGKSYAVFKDSKLAQDKFPTPEAAENFKDPAWNVEGNPWDQAITKATEFKASATSSTFDKANITGIEVTKDPTTMTYTEGDKPKHDGIKVKLTDKNGNTVEVEKDKLADYGVTVTPAEDKGLTVKDNNGKPFVAKVNGKDAGGQAKELTANGKTNITVNPKNSDEAVIPYVPADPTNPTNPDDTNVPTTDKDGNPVDKAQYDIVAFKVADADKTKGSLTLGDKDKKQVISALVKKDSKWDKVTVPTINVADANTKANGYKPAIPAKTETVENGKVYTAQFITNGQEITPGTDLPDGVFEVKVLRDETSIKDNALYGKSYAVFKDSKLAQDKFPTPEAAENFKDPAWNVEGNPWDQAITKATEFKASATSSTFDKANITGIEVTKDPTTMTYTEGDKPKHDGIKVKLTDKNGNTVEVEKDKLADYGVTVTPAEDKGLTVKDNNGKPFVAKVNDKDGKPLTADSKTKITVNPKNSDKDVIPFEPSDPTKPADKDDPNIPTTDDKNNPINREDYVVIGFKVSPDNSGSLTLGEQKDKAVISALVKKDSEWAKVTLPITNDGNDYTFWHWDNAPADKVAEGQVRIASFIKSGDEISPNETNPLPKDFHKVTVAKGTGVANNDLFGKTYAVKKDDTLAQDKFPTLEVSDATKYKDPAWNVTDPWTVPVADTDVTYTASATSTAFDASNVTDMTVKTQPKLDYVEGSADNGKLNLSSLVVTLTDKNGNTQDVPFAKLGDYGITADPANGTDLTVDANNGKPVTLTKGNLTATTENLQVTKPADKPTITNPAAKNEPGKDSTTVTGKTTPKTEVTVKDKDGKEIGKGNSDEDGNFSIDTNPKQNPGTEVTVTPKDGTPAKATVTEESAPAKPTIDQPYVGDKTISGTGEPDEMLVVTDKDDNLIAEIRVGKNGKWSVDVPTNKPLKKGDEITATQDGVSVTATVKAKTSSGGSSGGGSVIPSKPEPKPEKPSEGDLNKADHYQYLVGYPDGTFAPNRGMTRAEVATMFTRLLKDRPVKGKAYKVALSDVHAGDWYADTVGYAVEKGIVSGYPDGSFKPNQAITRAEFASIASRFAELTESKDLSFSDLDASYWGYKAIRLAASNGWISGYPDNTFRPEQAITRAEVTSITNRMLNRSADLDWINAHSAKVIHFSDVSAGDWFFEPVMEATMGHDFTRDKDGKAEKWTGLNDKTFI